MAHVTGGNVHRELLLPDPPSRDDSAIRPRRVLNLAAPHASWVELRKFPDDRSRLTLGAGSPLELSLTFNALGEAIPRIQLGRSRTCAVDLGPSDLVELLRAVVRQPTHFQPFARDGDAGGADLLLRNLELPALHSSEAVTAQLCGRADGAPNSG
jgi:hypothetical protein